MMTFDIGKITFAALLLLPLPTWATTVNRCEDDSGQITFTSLSCPPGHSLELQRAYNAPPGSIATAAPSPTTAANSAPLPNREIVVVGQRDDGCGNVLSAEQRRRAIIHLQTPAGMSKRDVESMLGKPDKITLRNQEERYVYDGSEDKKKKITRAEARQKRQVTFDGQGCVKKN